MPKTKQKIKLSESLQLGVSDPSSQSTLYKTGGIILTIFSILLAANIVKNLASTKSAPQTLATSQSIQPAVLGASSQTKISTYTVQPGDTLFSISQASGTSWEILSELNNLKAPYALKIGTSLKIPVQN